MRKKLHRTPLGCWNDGSLTLPWTNDAAMSGLSLYGDDGTTELTTTAQVNALTDMLVSGTTSVARNATPSEP